MVQNYSSPGFEVCDTETVCGVESHTAVAHDAAQQGPQIRWDPVQRNLRGHVVHFTHSEESAEMEQQKCLHVIYQNSIKYKANVRVFTGDMGYIT